MVIRVNIFQKELMVEIYSKSLVRAIGTVLLMKFNQEHQSKPIKVVENGGLHQ